MNSPRRTPKRLVRILLIGFLVMVIVFTVYAVWAWLSASQFGRTYEAYVEAQEEYIEVANKPAAEANPVRRQVYTLLAEVLQVEMSNEERIAKAKQGIAHLNDMESQIDAIKTEADKVIPLLNELEQSSNRVVAVQSGASMKELVSLGKRQVEIISDIRGLSYRADYYTSEVFERVIDDQGSMTDDHKSYLNDIIPQLEEQFDKRTNLYTELKENDDRMKRLADGLGI